MKNKARVHRLPTEEASQIATCKLGERQGLFYGDKPTIENDLQNYHLYITTDEEIKEGDWYILGKQVRQAIGYLGKPDKGKYLKIIATTDPKLGKEESPYDTRSKTGGKWIKLPQMPQSFIEEYCKAGGIDKVLVEYKKYHSIADWVNPIMIESFIPKLNPDNTIIIHPVEEKMYSREEMFVFFKWMKTNRDFLNIEDLFDKWIEENL